MGWWALGLWEQLSDGLRARYRAWRGVVEEKRDQEVTQDDEHIAKIIKWPEPREDPKEEPTEPWAKLRDKIDKPK